MTSAAEFVGRFSGRPVRVAAPVDSGGGGAVCPVDGHPALVAKLFHAPCSITDPLGRRLLAVHAKRLTDPHLTRVDDLLVAADDPDTLAGFTMDRVRGHTLYSVTNPDERRLLAVALSPLDRLRLAGEVARAFETLHRRQIRLGDAHHRNLMVTFDRRGRAAGVVVLEPDTWIFEWRTGGRMERFTSPARADFLPAEFQGADLSKAPLTVESDRFALALLVALALFDCTPFAFAGSAAPVERRIAAGHEWVTPNLPPGASAPDRLPIDPAVLPPAVRELLRRGVSRTPSERATAAEWATALVDWHRQVLDRSAAGRFLAALAALGRSRTAADAVRRAADVFFAALRRFAPAVAAKPARWWAAVAVKVGLVVAGVAGLGLWAGSPDEPATPPPQPTAAPAAVSPLTLPSPPPPAAPPAGWRTLIEPTDPDPE